MKNGRKCWETVKNDEERWRTMKNGGKLQKLWKTMKSGKKTTKINENNEMMKYSEKQNNKIDEKVQKNDEQLQCITTIFNITVSVVPHPNPHHHQIDIHNPY